MQRRFDVDSASYAIKEAEDSIHDSNTDDDDNNESNENEDNGDLNGISFEAINRETVDELISNTMAGFHPDQPTYRIQKKLKKIRRIFPVIKKYGLLPPQFNALFEVIMSKKLPIGTSKRLVHYLLPRGDITDEYIVRIIASISHKEKILDLAAELLKWTISVYDIIAIKEKLRRLYHVLFHFLSYETIRPYACHLLYYLTRREHVTPFRVMRLKELIEDVKDNRELIGLMVVYQTYDLKIDVPHNVRLANRFVFQNPFPEIKNDITSIRQIWDNEYTMSPETEKPVFRLPAHKKPKYKKSSEKIAPEYQKTTPLELDIIDVTHIVNHIENLELSEQLSAVLDNRKMQHILVSKPDGTALNRLGFWITQKIMDLLRWGNKRDVGKHELREMLKKFVKVTRFAKSQLPCIEQFLFAYIPIWNGFDFDTEIFELITFIKPRDYKELYDHILKPLSELFIISDTKWKSRLILCYTDWLANWGLLDWRRHFQLRRDTDADMEFITYAFAGLTFNTNYFHTIEQMVQYVGQLSVTGFLLENDHPLIQHAGLSFFELAATLSLQDNIPDIIIPEAAFIQRTLYSVSAMPISRLCGIIYTYKLAFEENENKTEEWMSQHTPKYLQHFNEYVTDICNSLWRNKFLDDSWQEKVTTSLSRGVLAFFHDLCQERAVEANYTSSLTHSPALVGFAKKFMESLENEAQTLIKHSQPVTAQYLTRLKEAGGVQWNYLKYRIEYLEYLSNLGLTGIHMFLFGTMGSLKKHKRKLSTTPSISQLE
ncbi:Mis6-domain-containing protein [Mycotypha africana]|uniref:Mis6-domain-containing protein n=1 Tax=Mycotypha africana TaxID=64632 RepID=UPI0023010B24|nr:Mis6-domain-containing protein [Mycotypha africana]KAI8984632.1 Mis6-domain-containing protein [Mycotypha africana]